MEIVIERGDFSCSLGKTEQKKKKISKRQKPMSKGQLLKRFSPATRVYISAPV